MVDFIQGYGAGMILTKVVGTRDIEPSNGALLSYKSRVLLSPTFSEQDLFFWTVL